MSLEKQGFQRDRSVPRSGAGRGATGAAREREKTTSLATIGLHRARRRQATVQIVTLVL